MLDIIDWCTQDVGKFSLSVLLNMILFNKID